MRTLPSLGFLSFSFSLLSVGVVAWALAACSTSNNGTSSGDGGGAASSPTSCTTAMECNPDECVCSDGETVETGSACFQGSCVAGDDTSFCATSCSKHGGVSTVRPHPNVAASTECDAWCTKGASLACGSTTCDRFFFCGVPKGSCEAAARAQLQCAVEKGDWACSKNSKSWSTSSSCPTFADLCTGADAGSD
ncbi:MAG: hypothetical protein QOI41_4747 [Myxococcales bacterium]|nr:hypothetical protein [Myxococcales bacterium]